MSLTNAQANSAMEEAMEHSASIARNRAKYDAQTRKHLTTLDDQKQLVGVADEMITRLRTTPLLDRVDR